MNVKDITITKGRAKESVKGAFTNVMGSTIDSKINNAVENERIRTGVIKKFYPYLDKAEVKLDNDNQKILCKILHRFGGDMIDFFTPIESEKVFDENLREPAIIPRSPQHVCVLQIHDADSDENLILGYYQNEDIVGFDPAEPGNVKLLALTETNPYWIEFGRNGLDVRIPSEPTFASGEFDSNMKELDYANATNVYTKEEVYTKTEVDELIRQKIAEALEELNEGD